MKSVTMDDLIGERMLNTAPIMTTLNDKSDYHRSQEYDGFTIGLDYKTYSFYEDPSDGYRSYMGDITEEPGLNMKLSGAATINRKVIIRYATKDHEDLIEIIDSENGHLWARLGTDNYDSYYPTCIMEWNALSPDMMEHKNISEKTAKHLAQAFGYDEIMIYGRRNHVEHVATYRKEND